MSLVLPGLGIAGIAFKLIVDRLAPLRLPVDLKKEGKQVFEAK
jgi:hypothetical protein